MSKQQPIPRPNPMLGQAETDAQRAERYVRYRVIGEQALAGATTVSQEQAAYIHATYGNKE